MDKIEFEHGMLPGSLELAYLGDAVYELRVRESILKRGGHVKTMHRLCVKHVCASAQAKALDAIIDTLSEDEAAVVKRARNAHQTPTKNADAADYHHATALEALFGYLYVMGRAERLYQLMDAAIEITGE